MKRRRWLFRWLLLWVAATLVFGIAGFFDSTWASRYDPLGRCGDRADYTEFSANALKRRDPGVYADLEPTRVDTERWPPRVVCTIKECRYPKEGVRECRDHVLVANSNAIDWLILTGYSAWSGFFVSLLLLALLWLLGRLGVSWPRGSNPFVWIDRR